jgi:hypothetical protein
MAGDLRHLLHFVAFLQVASLFSIWGEIWDNEKALELNNSTVFHNDRQKKWSTE